MRTIFFFQSLKILTEMWQIFILNIFRNLFHDFRIFCWISFLLFLLLPVEKQMLTWLIELLF